MTYAPRTNQVKTTMFALKKKPMAPVKPRDGDARVDVGRAYQRMMAKLPKTFDYLGK